MLHRQAKTPPIQSNLLGPSDTEPSADDEAEPLARPLADRLRPRTLDDYVGQEHLLGAGRPLRQLAQRGIVHSMIFWGPPGTGKTTLARLLADAANAHWLSLSAVLAGVRDVREAIAKAEALPERATVLFIDEVHRFNKAQQDAFLPHVEKGTVVFIGATTENPSFEVNAALLSRSRVFLLKPLEAAHIEVLLQRAAERELRLEIAKDAVDALVALADGDARRALNTLEIAAQLANDVVEAAHVQEASGQSYRRFDKGGDAFYDQISALHKAVRGSSPDAALYWLARMLDGGCDPLYIARRLARMASEDIGNADPRALQLCVAAWDAYRRLGSPEGELALAQAVLYLASVPKSNAVEVALGRAMAFVREQPSHPVPLRLRNAPTGLATALGHGKGYRYAHAEEGAYAAGERYFPDEVPDQAFYEPSGRGLEAKVAERLVALREQDRLAREHREEDAPESAPRQQTSAESAAPPRCPRIRRRAEIARLELKAFLWVAAGGACGAVLRYGLQAWASGALPWGTFAANVLGSLAIGGLVGAFDGAPWFEAVGRAFLVAGVLGAFTTFSAFSADALLLWEQERHGWCVAYVLGSVALSLSAALAGYRIAGALT